MRERYYLHGDAHESSFQKYYCTLCDAIENEAHFSSDSHKEINHDKYLETLERFKNARSSFLEQFTRPSSAKNLFSHLVKSKVKISRFYSWLSRQKERKDPIGDLAIEAMEDKKFPKDSDSYDKVESHLFWNHASEEAIQALTEAFNEFKGSKGNRVGIPLNLRFQIFKRDNYKCRICGASVRHDNIKLEIDHKIPVSKGGTNDENNLWTLCFNCNRGKRTSEV